MTVEATLVTFHDGYIAVLLSGASVRVSRQYEEIHEKAFLASREHACPRILIDASHITYVPDVLLEHDTAIDLMRKCVQYRGTKPFRVAVVSVSSADKANLHLENTARNRGVNVKVFLDRDAAAQWLHSA